MIKPLAVSAATFFALTAILSSGARAGCDEDCAYEAHEAAYEQASEHAEAREEAVDEGYVFRGRERSSSSMDRSGQASRKGSERRTAEPKPEAQPQPPPRTTRSKIADGENSSISTGRSKVADDDSSDRAPASKEVGCKKFFAAAGMTLTVPCE